MSWIKRNLFFVIGGVVALVLMGASGYYFYSKLHQNTEVMATLNTQYDTLKQLNAEPILPSGPNVDNIKIAKEQAKELRQFIEKARAHFQRIQPIPDSTNITAQDFSTALTRTIDQLSHEATNS